MTRLHLSAFASAFLLIADHSTAQDRATACFFANDFEAAEALNGWDQGPQVERRTPEGTGTGEFVNAWTLGTAAEANAQGYFPVNDDPIGGRFVMANDAAAPCNCDMQDVLLTSPVMDLSGRSGVALECRIFNENILGAGPASLEVSTTAGVWTAVDTFAVVEGAWQRVFVDLGAFDGATSFWFRFRWSDGGGWAGGFAVDDVCIRERLAHDLVVTNAQVGASTASPFTTGDQGMYYRQLPRTQAAPIRVAATVRNGGTVPLQQVRLEATVDLNGTPHGPFNSEAIAVLAPGEVREVVIQTGWQPDATGTIHLTVTGSTDATEASPEDNVASGSLHVTGPGWDDGYSAMSCDGGVRQGSVGGQGGFIASTRLEVANPGDHATGVSVLYAPGTEVGAVVRAILMDADFNTLDTSTRRVLAQADIDAAWNGLPVYEAFASSPLLLPGDVQIGIQQLTSPDDLPVKVSVSGSSTPGRSVLLTGPGFTQTPLFTTPMVRLHLSEVPVNVAETGTSAGNLRAWPSPASTQVNIALPKDHVAATWLLLDAAGRAMRHGSVPNGATSPLALSVADLSAGIYRFILVDQGHRAAATIVVAHP